MCLAFEAEALFYYLLTLLYYLLTLLGQVRSQKPYFFPPLKQCL